MPGSEPPQVRVVDRPSQRPGGAASLIGTMIGERYRIDSILGEGGMGTVYAAEHTLMRKRVALKVLHPDMGKVPDMVARFEREAMAAGHIDHPNIAAATDFGQLPDGSFFLVLEFVEGENLREVIARGHIEVARAVHIGVQMANALARAHSLGVVHRDLKPDNVMLITRNGDPDFVKVLDFGIAKVPILELGAPPPPSAKPAGPVTGSPKVLTQIGMIYGTPEYMAPEQALGQPIDGRADLYAVGILLYEMLTGRRPFDHDNMASLLGLQVAGIVPPMSERVPDVPIPSAIEAVVRRLLAKDPAQRFATAGELEEALTQATMVTLPTEVFPAVSSMRLSVEVPSIRNDGTPISPSATRTEDVERARRLAGMVVFAALAVGFVVLLFTCGHRASSQAAADAPVASSSASTDVPTVAVPPSATAPAADDALASVLMAAESAVAKNDPASAIAALAPLEAANANRADLHRILERAYAMSHDRTAALREADAWLAIDPSASSNLPLQADIGEVATRPTSSEAAIALLASRMGEPGVDILYDLAYASTQDPSVSHHAKEALARDSVRAHAGPAAAVLLDLHAASTCEEKRALLPRVRTDGDRRALALLPPVNVPKRSWGACMRHDTDLASTIAAIRGRSGKL